MKVLYVATKRTNTVVNYRATLDAFGYDHQMLGFGEKWEGWRYRMKKYRDACLALEPTEIIVLSDAEDVLACRDSQEFIEKFKKFNQPIVFSSEEYCYSNCVKPVTYWANHPTSSSFPNRYVNAGMMAGYAAQLASMWQWILDARPFINDDQVGLGHYMNQFYNNVALDSKCQLFYNLKSHTELPLIDWVQTVSGDRKRYKIISILDKTHGKVSPYFLHFPGHSFSTQIKSTLSLSSPKTHVYDPIAQKLVGDEALQAIQIHSTGQLIAVGILYLILFVLTVTVVVLVILYRIKIIHIRKLNHTHQEIKSY